MKFHSIPHNFVPVKQVNNVVLARCNCCSTPRWAVYLALRGSQEFWYHGFDEQEAIKTFNFLVRRQAQQAQIQ